MAAKPKQPADVIFAELTEKHGPLSAADAAIAMALARELASENINPQTVTSLTALLPPPNRAAEGRQWNLDLLSNRQLAALERLQAIALGEAPPAWQHRPRSDAYWGALDLATVIDRIVKHGGVITESDRVALCNAMHDVVYRGLQLTPLGFYCALYGDPTPSRPPAVPEPAAERAVPSELPSNVVHLPLQPDSPWAALARVNGAGTRSPALFDASNPKRDLPEY